MVSCWEALCGDKMLGNLVIVTDSVLYIPSTDAVVQTVQKSTIENARMPDTMIYL
jgi:hypothetical protein